MKPYLKWIPLAAAILGMGALFGTTYFVTQYGIVIKSPATGVVTGHWNGTNGNLVASGTVSAASFKSTPVVISPKDATTWLVDMSAGAIQTNAIAGAVSLSVSNCVAGLPVTVVLLGTNVDETITFNSSLDSNWLCAKPSTISASKRMVISLFPQNADTNAVLVSAIKIYP